MPTGSSGSFLRPSKAEMLCKYKVNVKGGNTIYLIYLKIVTAIHL